MNISNEAFFEQIRDTYFVETEGKNNKDAINMLIRMVEKGIQSYDENIRTILVILLL